MATARPHSSRKRPQPSTPGTAGEATSGVLDKLGFAAGVVSFVPLLTGWILSPASWAADKMGFQKTSAALGKPNAVLEHTKIGRGNLSNAMLEGSFTVIGGLEALGVARSYSEKMESLKAMYTDMTGRKANRMASDKHVPKAVLEARAHIMKEHGVRGVLSTLGAAIPLRGLLKGGNGMKANLLWMLLPMASEGINAYMGESPVLHVYKGIADAHKRGETIPMDTYAQFVLAASQELQARGNTGKELAGKLAEQYAIARVAPAVILNEVENGRMMQRIRSIVESGQVALPSQPQEPVRHSDVAEGKKEQPVLGPETAKVISRREAEAQPALGA